MLRIGALAGIAGIVLQLWLSGLHAGHVDPNNSAAVFLEYAASGIWTAVHIGQYAGTFLIAMAMLTLARALGRGLGLSAALASIGVVAVTIVLAIFAIQMAVDGVALRETIATWVLAPTPDKAAAFYVADGVRWIEKGLSAFFHLNNGLALLTIGLAAALHGGFPRWLGAAGAIAGVAAMYGGFVAAQGGFSPQAAAILGPTALLGAAFLGGGSVWMWRAAGGGRHRAIAPVARLEPAD
jgi:hypothetical protein